MLEQLAGLAAAHPEDAGVACRHADALQLAGALAEAEREYRRSLALDKTGADAWYGLGAVCLARKAFGDAASALRRAVRLRPGAAALRCNLGEALFQLGMVDQAVAEYRVAIGGGDEAARENALAAVALIIPGSDAADNGEVLRARRDWLSRFGALGPVRARREAGGRLRVAYMSAYFGARNWMKPVWAVINRHDRAAMEVILISDGEDPSAESGYVEHDEDQVWRVRGLGNEALARHIAAAGVDVLVDLNGYSAQGRLAMLLRRPAPRIIGWFNMFATTGTGAFDAIVGDEAVIPVAEERFYAEPVVRVPGTYLAFEVRYPVPAVVAPPCLHSGVITFGCFGSGYKLTDGVLDAWARILAGAPGARLFVKNRTLGDPSCAGFLLERLVARGVDVGRVRLAGGDEHFAYLAAYGEVDVALDTFPYNGGTTTTEALWQGVPVIAFGGDRWAARTSLSLLRAAGLEEWVAGDVGGYVEQAVAVARDPATPARLAGMRAAMRERLAASGACDVAGLCRSLEAIYRG